MVLNYNQRVSALCIYESRWVSVLSKLAGCRRLDKKFRQHVHKRIPRPLLTRPFVQPLSKTLQYEITLKV